MLPRGEPLILFPFLQVDMGRRHFTMRDGLFTALRKIQNVTHAQRREENRNALRTRNKLIYHGCDSLLRNLSNLEAFKFVGRSKLIRFFSWRAFELVFFAA